MMIKLNLNWKKENNRDSSFLRNSKKRIRNHIINWINYRVVKFMKGIND